LKQVFGGVWILHAGVFGQEFCDDDGFLAGLSAAVGFRVSIVSYGIECRDVGQVLMGWVVDEDLSWGPEVGLGSNEWYTKVLLRQDCTAAS
jgi:hypothetical protein